ncbi:MAG: mandelate racemase/muconate lactonizing enzyme family protein [Arachnia sp.]
MRISDIEVIGMRVPVEGRRQEWGEDAVVVRVHTDEGLVGIGESDTSPEVLKAYVDAPYSHSSCMGLKEVLLGKDPDPIGDLWQEMYAGTTYLGRRGAAIHAISAIDIALWDIAGQARGVPVCELLGPRMHSDLPAYGTFIPTADPDASAATALGLKDQGLVGAKIGGAAFGYDLDADLAHLEAMRAAVGPDFQLMVDLVGRWGTARRAETALRLYRDIGLEWAEEPVPADDFGGYAELSRDSGTTIAGGEALETRFEFATFMDVARPDVVQPDITRCGGISEIMRIADLAVERQIRLVPHGFSTGILNAATAHFLVSRPEAHLVEMSASDSPLFTDLVKDPVRADHGRVSPPTGAGLGVVLNDDVLDNYRIF